MSNCSILQLVLQEPKYQLSVCLYTVLEYPISRSTQYSSFECGTIHILLVS
jgi:hypothetical protein